jgi:hypothetical protein
MQDRITRHEVNKCDFVSARLLITADGPALEVVTPGVEILVDLHDVLEEFRDQAIKLGLDRQHADALMRHVTDAIHHRAVGDARTAYLYAAGTKLVAQGGPR